MADLLSGLLALDRLAAARGDAFEPALAALLAAPRGRAGRCDDAPAATVVDLAVRRAERCAPVPAPRRAAP